MKRLIIALVMAAWIPVTTVAGEAIRASVSEEDARAWVHHTVPLPKQIRMAESVSVPAGEVAVRCASDAPPLVRQAVQELREALQQDPASPAPAEAVFVFQLELRGEAAAPLRELRNADQAYRIAPLPGGKGLRLSAIGSRGLYYASKTMQQLVRARSGKGRVAIPLVEVTDWPDLEDRGLWGSDASDHLRWMSDRKMNYIEHISHARVDRQKRCSVSFPPYKQRMIDEGPTYGINPVPVILHLEQLKHSGLFEAYPELQGKQATEGVICYSRPEFIDVLAEWLVLWGRAPGVREVDVWMAENLSGKKICQCDGCRPEDRNVLETRVILKAWEKARQRVPELGLRILTSEATEASNPKILALLPPGVKLWYYHSLYTYTARHRAMIPKYLAEAARGGRWVGVCPNIDALVGFWTPMTGAAFIHARMNEFVDKGLSGLLGYSVPRLYYGWFNTEAAAEWSWNAKGRSPREFALSYAVRRGYRDPEKFAAWSETMGPVSWDVYGCEYPSGEQRGNPGPAARLLKQGKLPELGSVLWDVFPYPFGDIRSREQLERDVAQAAEGVRLARELGIAEYLEESLVVQGYINAIRALWELKQLVTGEGVRDEAAARRWFQAYLEALGQAREHLPKWEQALPDRPANERLTGEPVKLLTSMIDSMKQTASEMGISLP